MFRPRGQSSVEFLVILAIGLVLVSVIAFFLLSQKSTVGSRSEIESAQLAVNDIAKAADDVFLQGAGSRKAVPVTVPESVELENSGISGKTVFLSLQKTNVFANSKVRMEGAFPKQKGSQQVFLNARADYVFVGESRIFLDKYSIYSSVLQGSSQSETIIIRNDSSAPLSVKLEKDWNAVNVFFELRELSFSLGPSESKGIVLGFSARPLATGQEKGRLKIIVSGNNYGENVSIPLTVAAKSLKSQASGSLRIIPNSWVVALSPGGHSLKTFKICNESDEELENVLFKRQEIFSKELPKVEGGIVWSVFSDSDYVYAGMQDGSLIVWMKDLTFFKKVSETSSAIRAITSDSDFLYAGSSDGKIYVIKKSDFTLETSLSYHSSPVVGLALDSEQLYSAGFDGIVTVWKKSDFSKTASIPVSEEALTSLGIDENRIFAGCSDGNVFVLRKQGLAFDRKLSEAGSTVNSVFADSGFLYVAVQDGRLLVYDIPEFTLHSVVSKSFSSVKQVFSSSSGNYVALAAADSGIYFFSRPEFLETFNSSAGNFMQSVYGSENTVFFGTEDSAVFAIDYGELVFKIAAYWIEGLDSVPSIAAKSCIDKNFIITVPPLTTRSTFFGDLNVESAKGSDVLQLQVNVQ